MIREILYKCEICGETYETQEAAERCEASHISAHNVYYENFPKAQRYPQYIVMTMDNGHRIQYKFDKPVIDIIPAGEPYITRIYVSNDPVSGQVILTAHGSDLPNEMYTWTMLFDGVQKIATSNEPKLIMSNTLSTLFNNSYVVSVKVSSPSTATTQFIVKEVS